MIDGINISILGDFGPFSRMGKSIGYRLDIGSYSYLIDCGSPLFQQIGGHGLKKINGLIITHCHDDHKRWFSDLALFNKYAPDMGQKVSLITAEDVHDDIMEASIPALTKSLSFDSRRVIDLAYEDFIEYRRIGPSPKFRIVSVDEGACKTCLYIIDSSGNKVGPERAKIIINPKTRRPRMLFKDPDSSEWVEPSSFYTFSSEVFYEKDRNIYTCGGGVTIEAIKAPVWHGVNGIGIRVSTGKEALVISSDTAHDKYLWESLCAEKRQQKLDMTLSEFESSPVIIGDINDYIERTWSKERYQDAISAFDDAFVIHDISIGKSVVHTDYEKLGNTVLDKEMTILTHSPDRMTSEWTLCNAGKTFRILRNKLFEVVGDRLHPMNADIYHKEGGKYFVGYKNDMGKYTVHDKNGLLRFVSRDGSDAGTPLYQVDLYEDIDGGYFPKIEDENMVYHKRPDGRVEILKYSEGGSMGVLAQDQRPELNPAITPEQT